MHVEWVNSAQNYRTRTRSCEHDNETFEFLKMRVFLPLLRKCEDFATWR